MLAVVDSAHLLVGIDGKLLHQQAIVQNDNICHLHVDIKGTCWAECRKDMMTLESILASRGERGRIFESLTLQFSEVVTEESEAEVSEKIDTEFCAKWLVGGRWIDCITYPVGR